ncbi:TPA: hypothetical protein JTN94_003726 [Escherichia coli]|nr:hypothetical protein [Escherichia coli]HAX7471808.1 hypothetical protein [Escherichia coli]
MAKLISTRELATIITALLVKPELLGELDSPEKHRAMMEDLGRVVAEHCGGNVTEIALSETDGTADDGELLDVPPVRYLETKESSPYLIVHPDDSLPSPTQNVWMHADPDGWEEHFNDEADALTPEMSQQFRQQVYALLTPESLTTSSEMRLTLQDWQLGATELPEEDCQPYQVKVSTDNNLQCEVVDESGTTCFGLILEIDRGVPTLHIDTGSDSLLHIHAAHDGLVLTPDAPNHRFEDAPVDRFSYNSPSLLVPGV